MLALDPGDSRHAVLVAKAYNTTQATEAASLAPGNVRSVHAATFDGGLTWTEGYLQPIHAPVALPAAGGVGVTTDVHTDPIVGVLPDGRVLALSERLQDDSTGPALLPTYLSADGGRTFHEGPPAYGEPTDEPWVAVDPETGAVVVVTLDFHAGAPSPAVFVRSADGGRTWSAPRNVPCPCFDPRIGIGLVGELDVVGYDFGNASIVFTRSRDNGTTWSPWTTVAPHHGRELGPDALRLYREPNFATVAVDRSNGPRRGTFYVAWADHPPDSPELPCIVEDPVAGGCPRLPDWDVWLARSRDGGATWSKPLRVNDDAPGPFTSHVLPALAVGPGGDVHVAWLEGRSDPSGLTLQAAYAHSADGEHVDKNIVLSDAPFLVPLSYHQAIFPGFVGDYIGLAASDDRAVIAFPDTRYGQADIFVATVQ
jgi:hypothetical protein